MAEDPIDPRLSALERGLQAARDRQDAEARAAQERLERARAAQNASAGWRIVIDIVVATGLGGGMGYGIDRLVGSGPWGVIIGLLAGFGVAMWLAIRWAQAIQRGASAPDERK